MNYIFKIKHLLTSFIIFLTAIVLHIKAYAQTPRNVPQPHDSYSFNLDTLPGIILYIGLPVVIIVLFILYRRREKKRRNDK
ncbi:MAG: hypothetical protein M3512_11235 [Bacteroidota bacterium]|nr:hypothetical protein [Bacteroidota bacterium]